MKAKELFEILQKHPEAEVIIEVEMDSGECYGVEHVSISDAAVWLGCRQKSSTHAVWP